MRHDGLIGWPRKLLHLIVILLGWALFVYWWVIVAVRQWDKTQIALIIFVTVIVAPVLTIAWVAHNLSIFRRKGPRLGIPAAALGYERDWNGRTVVAEWERLRESALVVVSVEGDRKHFAGAEVPPGPAAG